MTERWMEQVEQKRKRGNQILFDRSSVLLQPLIDLICVQNHRAIVLWCLDCMETILAEIQHIDPMETRAKEAICQCQLWSAGEIRMPQAKKAGIDLPRVSPPPFGGINKAERSKQEETP